MPPWSNTSPSSAPRSAKTAPTGTSSKQDLRHIRHEEFTGIDLLAAGVPCPPFSIASKQLGADDIRDMFPSALQLVEQTRPRAVLFENVPGLASAKFQDYRAKLLARLSKLGYLPQWTILQAADYGVPQFPSPFHPGGPPPGGR